MNGIEKLGIGGMIFGGLITTVGVVSLGFGEGWMKYESNPHLVRYAQIRDELKCSTPNSELTQERFDYIKGLQSEQEKL